MIQKLKADLSLIEKEKCDVCNQLADVQAALENFKNESSAELERQAEAYRQQRTDFEHTFKDTLNEKQRLEKELEELNKKISQFEVSQVESQPNANSEQLAQLEQQVNDLLNDKQRLGTELEEVIRRLTENEVQLKAYADSNSALEHQLDMYRKQILVSDQKFNDQVDHNQQLTEQLQNVVNELGQLEESKKSEFDEFTRIFESNEKILCQQIIDLTEKLHFR
jgi:chromosome segregation ATPase